MLLAEAPRTNRPSIQEMKERHFEMMRRLVAGEPAVEICEVMGMTQAWFSIVQASPVFQAELTKLRAEANANAADVGARLKDLAPDAVGVLEKAVRGRKMPDGSIKPVDGISETQRTKFAIEALALAGHTKPAATQPSQVAIKVEVVQFSAPAPTATIIQGEVHGA